MTHDFKLMGVNEEGPGLRGLSLKRTALALERETAQDLAEVREEYLELA